MKKFTKGFTLIELLIVIALLGALAVALLAALDPLEQIKKGTDTGTRNTVSEIAGAFIRYASLQNGSLPYTTSGLTWGAVGTVTTGAGTTQAVGAIQTVIDAGELKTDFFALAKNQLQNIYIVGDTTRTYVCFAPSSKSFKADLNTKFVGLTLNTGTATATETTCSNGTAPSGQICYWCMR